MNITDTHKAVKTFESAGFSTQQSEVLADQDERTAKELVDHIRLAFAPEFERLRAEIHSTARNQILSMIAILAVGLTALGLILRGIGH